MEREPDWLIGAVRSSVEDFKAKTPREVASRQRVLAELQRLAQPFDRGSDPVHITGSAIAYGPRGTVLHLHKRLGRWLQPGGHVDHGEAPWDAALRETREETGLAGTLAWPPAALFHVDVHPAGDHVHLDLRYLVECPNDDPCPQQGESQLAYWFSVQDALALADDGLKDALGRLKALADAAHLEPVQESSSSGANSQSRPSRGKSGRSGGSAFGLRPQF